MAPSLYLARELLATELLTYIATFMPHRSLCRLDTAGRDIHYGGLTRRVCLQRAGTWLASSELPPRAAHMGWVQWSREVRFYALVKGNRSRRIIAGGFVEGLSGNFSLVIRRDGSVFANGALMVDDPHDACTTRVLCLKAAARCLSGRAVQATGSSRHVLVLMESGDVMRIGDAASPSLENDSRSRDLHVPVAIEGLRGKVVVQVAAGGAHSLILTKECGVLTLAKGGCIAPGACGHGERTVHTGRPMEIEALRRVRVRQVAAGGYHSMLLLEEGDVMSCGLGLYGQLGHGDYDDRPIPTRVDALRGKGVTHVSAGHTHSLVLLGGGGVMSFGDGDYGRLGHGDERSRHTPTRVVGLQDQVATQISAGHGHSLVLLADRRLVTFGRSGFRDRGIPVAPHAQLTPAFVHGVRASAVAAGMGQSVIAMDDGYYINT